jgi:hypothetical protein
MKIIFNGFQQVPLLSVMKTIINHFKIKKCAAIYETQIFLSDDIQFEHHDFWLKGTPNYAKNTALSTDENIKNLTQALLQRIN